MTIMQRLKMETQVYHHALEQHPLSLNLMSQQPDRHSYGTLLRKFYGFYAPIEARFATFPTWEQHFSNRRKVHLLTHDLQELGLSDAPTCPTLPTLDHFEQVLGCMYVLEGATLGGNIICRHLKKHLPDTLSFRFYHSYGDDLGPMWKSFGGFVTQYATTPTQEDQIVGAACETFILMEQWLNARCSAGYTESE